MLKVITERTAIEEFHKKYMSKMESYPHEVIETTVGWPSGSDLFSVKYYESVDMWFYWSAQEDHYWMPFGLGKPIKNTVIKVGINIPYYPNRRMAGVYMVDELDNLFIGHRGTIGGGRKGIGKQLFFDNYNRRGIKFIEDDGCSTQIAIISKLEDKNLLENIKNFVVEIDRIKNLRSQ